MINYPAPPTVQMPPSSRRSLALAKERKKKGEKSLYQRGVLLPIVPSLEVPGLRIALV